MAISEAERKLFERIIDEVGQDPEKAGVTIKIFFNFIRKTTSLPIELQSEVKKFLEQYPYQGLHASIQEDLKKISEILMRVAQGEEIEKTYSTGQLAKFFGVSITTINNWIAAGRFVGVERSKKNKQARIAESTIWISPSGERIPVREIIETYQQKQDIKNYVHSVNDDNLGRIRYIVETINFYEKRYGKPFTEVILEKGDPEETLDWVWAREGKEWRSLLREIGDQ